MPKLEKSLLFVSIIAFSLWLILPLFNGTWMILSIGSMALFYFYGGIAVFNNFMYKESFSISSYSKLNGVKLGVSFLASISLAYTIIGIIFKLLQWPHGSFISISGIAFLLSSAILSRFLQEKIGIETAQRIIRRMVLGMAVSLLFVTTSSYTFLSMKYRNHPTYREALKNAKENPNNEKLWEKLEMEKINMQK